MAKDIAPASVDVALADPKHYGRMPKEAGEGVAPVPREATDTAPKDTVLAFKAAPDAKGPDAKGPDAKDAPRDAAKGGPKQEIRKDTGLSRFLASASGGDDDDE